MKKRNVRKHQKNKNPTNAIDTGFFRYFANSVINTHSNAQA